VNNPDPVTRISASEAAGSGLSLGRAAVGQTVRVTAMPDAARAVLEQEGVVKGSVLRVERRVGLGGPVVVRLGRARLAIARAVAATVQVEAATEDGGRLG
jgi:Fe2+ transport system protein FeoA